ncbi:glycosyltransferase [Croceicoccus sp. BE223]|uniref:glycosyltransferase n=1 Tax=Croceicoccus sp. BE223 TaxID=2817716 RepID=UPI0028588C18|nr:glycosyltransferase [Croceicoccus sp. BE223]MDR7102060.1 poly(glycerol-phosphate) alpha-glucosyltransferase [Croceicoccus sp. BE223]
METPLGGLRIGLLTASASRLGGGVFEAVAAQAAMLAGLGAQPAVFALADAHAEEDRGRFGPVPVTTRAVLGPRQVGYAPGLIDALLSADLDALHLHGIWTYPSAAGAAWAARSSKGYAISPHGMLDPWITGRGRWKKALARAGYERRGWRAATLLHALTGREATDIEREIRAAGSTADIRVIGNAAPAAKPPRSDPGRDTVFIGRIHAKKNLSALVAGFSLARRRNAMPASARLVIAGWGDAGDIAALRSAIAEADAPIEFVGPVFGERKQALLDKARFVALPSLSEGLPVAILEAWAAATPVLMSTECNIPDGFKAGAAIDCGMTAERVAQALARGYALDAEGWRAMSAAAMALAGGPFSARSVSRDWVAFYRELAAMGSDIS